MSHVLKIKDKDSDEYVITAVDNFLYNKAKAKLTVYAPNTTTTYQYAYGDVRGTSTWHDEVCYENVTFLGVDSNNGAPMWVFEGTWVRP